MEHFWKERFITCVKGMLAMHRLSLRQAAAQSGVSASTLSRVQRGYPPDIETFFRLCDWMGIAPGEFAAPKELKMVSGNTTGLWSNQNW